MRAGDVDKGGVWGGGGGGGGWKMLIATLSWSFENAKRRQDLSEMGSGTANLAS